MPRQVWELNLLIICAEPPEQLSSRWANQPSSAHPVSSVSTVPPNVRKIGR
jgi:hypothetical protein